MTPTDKIKMGFADGSKHFVLMVRREGETTGSGPFAGAKMVEHGWHDINPPVSGAPHGYLEVAAAGGHIAYLKWSLQVDFGKNGGKMAIMNRGVWQLVSGTGQFAGQSGVGTLEIRQAPEGRRVFVLTGEVLPQP